MVKKCFYHWVILGILAVVLAACGTCGAEDVPTQAAEATIAITPTSVVMQNTPLPTIEATAGMRLVVWWPEVLAPVDRPDVTDLLNQQISAFTLAEGNAIEVEFRLKTYNEQGGILPSLSAANAVAPGALPDLTLVRRQDLVSLVSDELLHPLEGLISSAIIGDLYDPALTLGQIGGQFYGLPYTLQVPHLLMHGVEAEESDALPLNLTFNDILSARQNLFFPADSIDVMDDLLLLPYLAAGGTLPDSGGTLRLNEAALLTVFQFYERAYDIGVIAPEILGYTTVDDYLSNFIADEEGLALVFSDDYLEARTDGHAVRPLALPSASGQAVTSLDGWLWVMTTSNTEHQNAASQFLNWMMETNNQSDYARLVYKLPSRQSSLQNWDRVFVPVDDLDNLLQNAEVALPANTDSALLRAMYSVVLQILSGDITAEEGVQAVIEQVGGGS